MTADLCKRLVPLGLALGCAGLSAGELPLDLALKLRGGVQVGEEKDHLNRMCMGFGLELGYAFGGGHRVGVELGWSYKPGTQYFHDLSTAPSAPGYAIDATPGVSVDNRKNEMKGLAVRVGYQKSFGDFGLNAGVQVGGSQFRHEYFGDIRSAASTPEFRDVYNGTPQKNARALSPFAGVSYRIDRISSLELNVLALRYTAIDYVHQAAYVTSTVAAPSTDVSRDRLVERKRTVPHVEFAYVLHF